MARQVFTEEEFELQDGRVVKVRPLTLTRLRKFMEIIQKMEDASDEDGKVDELEMFDVMFEAVVVALEKYNPDIVENKELLMDSLDIVTMNEILELSGGVSFEDPNLTPPQKTQE